ncbi:site-specific DNA-methyltransferase [Agrobacterium tumefaciens]|uniref:DNA-methyltransferase n=1 Tax=Agrobacterium tumefaciens TaxID=358 RepID=UPI0021CFE611|nr:site-specific DNA-methyltransferase [Agrobacterium tumefaciens]UXT51661.1 site-specific DNA-methyltransferase [Agrobacterium tumefaciens]
MDPLIDAKDLGIYPDNRSDRFRRVQSSLADETSYSTASTSLVLGDSLEILKKIPDRSVDLVLTDPPYHSTKKHNIVGDRAFDSDDEFLAWMNEYLQQFRRILTTNGSLYLFCSSSMAPFLYCNAAQSFTMHNLISWSKPNEPGYDGWKQKMNKTALRTWYPHSERIIFCSPAYDGNLRKNFFGQYLRAARHLCQLSSNRLTELVGAYGSVNNGGAVSNWETGRNIPSRVQWAKIRDALLATGRIEFVPDYEDVIRAFEVNPDHVFIDVWDFMNVRQYKGKHPAEKPQDMLKHIISTSSYEGDIVLDCFSGSGSTAKAAISLNRKAIGIEIDQHWHNYAHRNVHQLTKAEISVANAESRPPITENLPLFCL